MCLALGVRSARWVLGQLGCQWGLMGWVGGWVAWGTAVAVDVMVSHSIWPGGPPVILLQPFTIAKCCYNHTDCGWAFVGLDWFKERDSAVTPRQGLSPAVTS